MRGPDQKQDVVFSYLSPEERVPTDHPLRKIRTLVDEVLKDMSPQFGKLYSDLGRPSIAPERLLRALLLQIFYSVRSERLLMEQLDYNLLFRWFVGMNMDEQVWVATVFTKNRDRLLKHSIAESFFQRVLKVAQPYLSDEHFTVDGTLIEAWASQKSFQRKDGGSKMGKTFTVTAQQSDPRVQDRPGRQVVPQKFRQRGAAELFRAHAGGKSQWLDRGNLFDRSRWTR